MTPAPVGVPRSPSRPAAPGAPQKRSRLGPSPLPGRRPSVRQRVKTTRWGRPGPVRLRGLIQSRMPKRGAARSHPTSPSTPSGSARGNDAELDSYLATARMAAREAAAIQRAELGSDLQVETKSSEVDLVTKVDRACEERIRSVILASHPGHVVLGEEAGTGSPATEAAATAAQGAATT